MFFHHHHHHHHYYYYIMDVEIISVEIIKPSFPTPKHLRNFKLCLLDQLIPAAYAPIVLYYHNPNNSPLLQTLDLLKKSLSSTLSSFFPLAGSITGDFSVECDDRGARFTTAKVKNCPLSDFLDFPDLKSISELLPCGMERRETDLVTNIQATSFECGGISIGICISHRVLDGAGLSTFLKSWLSPSRGKEIVLPDFSASSVFPAEGSWLKDASMAMWGSLMKSGRFVTKRFVFDGPTIEALKDRATGPTGARPTRVETVSGFIWKCGMAACKERFGSKRTSLITHLVNLRKRVELNLSEHSIGNLIWVASAKHTSETEREEFSKLVDEVRKGISRIGGDFLTKLRGREGEEMMRKCLEEIEEFGRGEGSDHFGFTSWCKLGFYDVDFGWGRPVWVSSTDASGPVFMNLVILIDGRSGGGMEAWVTLDEQEMDILEHSQEFQAFASFNPNPLNVIGNGDT